MDGLPVWNTRCTHAPPFLDILGGKSYRDLQDFI